MQKRGVLLPIMAIMCSAMFAAACNDPQRTPGSDGGESGGFDAALPPGDGSIPSPPAIVYAHSDSTLYSVDATTLAVTKIGDFIWPNGGDTMNDIAIDKGGKMVGISSGAVYSVSPTTAKCTFLATFQGFNFNGLSFIASTSGAETLVGADETGSVYSINATTGAQTLIGDYGNGYGSSGDLVSVQGATYATVSGAFNATDGLVKLDPLTGKATLIGDTGVANIWGLGYWKQRVFGFTESNGIVIIDVTTGHSTPVSGSSSISWYGAGVTTSAPTTIQ